MGVVLSLGYAHFQKAIFEFIGQLLIETEEELLEYLVVCAEEEVELAVSFFSCFFFYEDSLFFAERRASIQPFLEDRETFSTSHQHFLLNIAS